MPLLTLLSLLLVGATQAAPVELAAAAGPPPHVVQDLGDGVRIDWTVLRVEVTGGARGSGTESSRKAVEQLARGKVGPGIQAGAEGVRINGEQTVADLVADPALADAVRSRISRWAVIESRYFASGRVELVGGLRLEELLRPWALEHSAPRPIDPIEPRFTGVLIDARGSGAVPAWAPRLLDPRGDEIFQATVWHELALDVAPVHYVSDPAHPAANRAGDLPLILRASHAQGPDLVLDSDDAQSFRTIMARSARLGEGHLVVVLDLQ